MKQISGSILKIGAYEQQPPQELREAGLNKKRMLVLTSHGLLI